MEELKQAFYEVMYKYKKEFGEAGVMANLNTWARNKAALLEMLRRHPQWNEEAKAIVFTFDEGRGIEHDVVDEIAFTMEDLAAEQIKDAERRETFNLCLRTAVNEYSSTLSEQALEMIRTCGGIKCATGQKTSRIIGKLCREFGVDRHERYNAVFAQLSDALNPLQMMKTALLSLHPCDFLEMSNKDNTWTSCHNLEDGSYQAGALSYMTDDVSMIFFTVDPDVTDHFTVFRDGRDRCSFIRTACCFSQGCIRAIYPNRWIYTAVSFKKQLQPVWDCRTAGFSKRSVKISKITAAVTREAANIPTTTITAMFLC